MVRSEFLAPRLFIRLGDFATPATRVSVTAIRTPENHWHIACRWGARPSVDDVVVWKLNLHPRAAALLARVLEVPLVQLHTVVDDCCRSGAERYAEAAE